MSAMNRKPPKPAELKVAPADARPARQADDPDKYIRRLRNGRYQARPFDLGVRYDLGTFATKAAARKAVEEFWWGKRLSLPRHVKRLHTKAGERYSAVIRVGLGNNFATREAAAAVEAWVRARFLPEAAVTMLSRER